MISLPGVPFEMKHLMNEKVIPKLKKSLNPILNKTLLTYGLVKVILLKELNLGKKNY